MESTGRFTKSLRRLMSQSYDSCRSCGVTLKEGVASYAGYAADDSPLYVGDCCKGLVEELATHVYWWWEKDKRCSPETKLWRYMDFAKFVALLEAGALHFARADLLGDPFEGASGIVEQRPRWDEYYLNFFRTAMRTLPEQSEPPDEAHVEKEAARLLRDISLIAERERQRSFVSCWHANENESEALWRLYCSPPMPGVAIGTTSADLVDALGDDPQIRLGHVQYVDFRHGFADFHDRIFWKRKSLSHEAEVRAVILKRQLSEPPTGLFMQTDLRKLLRSVVPSPFAPGWFPSVLEATMRRYRIDAPVQASELLSQPFF
jgi:hypothetical protein